MLYESMVLLETQLNTYFNALRKVDTNILESPVLLESVGNCSEEDLRAGKNIFLSLVHVAGEQAFVNKTVYPLEGRLAEYQAPPMHLNLCVLICACMPRDYKLALKHLSHVVQFFNNQKVFTGKGVMPGSYGNDDWKVFTLMLDLYAPNLEETYYLWSTQGGRQYPFVLCKLRLTEATGDEVASVKDPAKGTIANEYPAI